MGERQSKSPVFGVSETLWSRIFKLHIPSLSLDFPRLQNKSTAWISSHEQIDIQTSDVPSFNHNEQVYSVTFEYTIDFLLTIY